MLSFERYVPKREEATVTATLAEALKWWDETSKAEPIRVNDRWAWMYGWDYDSSRATVRVLYLFAWEAEKHEAELRTRKRAARRRLLEIRLRQIESEADLIRLQLAALA